LVGKLDEAERLMGRLDPSPFTPVLRAAYELTAAGIAIRRVRAAVAEEALARAKKAAQEGGISALVAEIEAAASGLKAPAARLISRGLERPLALAEVESLLGSEAVIVDACRHIVRYANAVVSLSSRPVLFALVRALAEAWPGDVSRSVLVARAFRGRRADESYRARLRVEIGRLRRALRSVASINATEDGFALMTRRQTGVVVLAQPLKGTTRRCWRYSQTANHGPVRLLASPSEPVSAPYSADWTRWRRQAKSSHLAVDRLAAGLRHRCPESRRRCYSQFPYRAIKVDSMKKSPANIVSEFGPFPGGDRVNGVTYDGQQVWFATGDKLMAIDPKSGKHVRSIDVPAHAGTAFDGKHLYQIAENRIQKIDPSTGRVLSTIPAPGAGGDTGLAWAEGTLWVGHHRGRKIHQIDAETGTILRTIESNRFVTGVTWTDGELWHGTWEGDESDVRQVDPATGKVLEQIEMPPGTGVSGLESDGKDHFFCGGGSSGTVRVVRRPKRHAVAH
jgi:glutamine cyclotransferase